MNMINPQKTDHKESSDNYHRIIVQDGKWRIIVCKDHIQWILQRRRKSAHNTAAVRWDGVSYCVTQKALDRLWREKTGCPAPEIDALPANFRRDDYT